MPQRTKKPKRGRPRKHPMPARGSREKKALYKTEALAPVPKFVECPRHPTISYELGGFCTACFAEDTQNRIKLLDDGFADLVTKTLGKAKEILDLPVTEQRPVILRGGHALVDKKGNPIMQTVIASEILSPIVRLIEMTQKRFSRPEQLEIKAGVKHVGITNPLVDYTQPASSDR